MLILKNIKKLYENDRGIKDISIEITSGEILAILGPNGSGKSTALKVIAGILKPDEGKCTIFDYNTLEPDTKKYIGYLPDEPFLYENLSPIEFLNFVQSMKEIKENTYNENILREFGMWEYRNQQIKTFSLGMKKRIALISAIVSTPKLLILDEPTNGLDTKSILVMKKYINKLKNNGSIIVISSHILEFVAKITNNIVFIKDGTIVRKINSECNLEQIYTDIYL
ncbi:ABC transporter ATP-binding protein [Clostridium estertheticum]|uniref:ABC transporter ATP-binding protein n=1 Tax=Clostridium estertheticum TaxID=238834 RepID=UPI001CF5AE4E|nr:ABC transporter ATP-binding protein [Clostridium estertheticum]MCB2342880.1 ABC transporter ATP-binding protein [Clostridium estertheticum]